jgi:hypothetical protein
MILIIHLHKNLNYITANYYQGEEIHFYVWNVEPHLDITRKCTKCFKLSAEKQKYYGIGYVRARNYEKKETLSIINTLVLQPQIIHQTIPFKANS